MGKVTIQRTFTLTLTEDEMGAILEAVRHAEQSLPDESLTGINWGSFRDDLTDYDLP